mmetsp:Transcript_133571/g.426958  ORF Transcript_133571/g.426958 Transcript_133571/m.426958 type:complete len:113 (+) Transcript_133571:53-391(+)
MDTTGPASLLTNRALLAKILCACGACIRAARRRESSWFAICASIIQTRMKSDGAASHPSPPTSPNRGLQKPASGTLRVSTWERHTLTVSCRAGARELLRCAFLVQATRRGHE